MMNYKTAITLVCTLVLMTGSVKAADYAIALSPFQSPVAATEQVTAILQFVTTLEPADRIQFYDGYHLELIGTFNIPANAAYNSQKARLAVNAGVVKQLLAFAQSAHQPTTPTEPSHSGAVRLPQLLRTLASSNTGSTPVEVIVLGSALYDDPAEPVFAMTQGRYPSDGHLSHTRGETVFGAKGTAALLEQLRVHLAYGAQSHFASEAHRFYVERFWTLFVQSQGGELVSFAAELSTVLARVRSKAAPVPQGFERDTTDKLEMIRLRQVEVQESIYQRTLSTEPLPQAQVQRAERVEVGLAWDCADCDLDIYALAHPDAELIYFNHTATPLGTLWKDHTTAPRDSQGFETIAYTAPLDLRALRLAVNFYKGTAPDGVRGEVRLAVDGQTYSQPFHILATTGNGGADVQDILARNQQTGTHTLLLDPLAIVSTR